MKKWEKGQMGQNGFAYDAPDAKVYSKVIYSTYNLQRQTF